MNRSANLLLAGTAIAVMASSAQAWADSLSKNSWAIGNGRKEAKMVSCL